MTTGQLRLCLAARLRTRALLAALAVPMAVLAGGAAAEPAALPSNVTHAVKLGRTAATQQISVTITLPSRDAAGAAAFATGVSTPGNPLFRQYLTPAQFAAKFGAKPADYATVKAWAKAQGLTPGEVFAARTVLPVTGSAAAIEAAFGVQLNNYKDATGRIFYQADAAPVLPAAISGLVSGVVGLSSSLHFEPTLRRLPAGLHPSGGTGPDGAFFAADLRALYLIPGAPPLPRNETVALFEQGGFDPNDIKTYLAANKLAKVPVRPRSVDGYGTGIDDPGIELEAVLDIDMVIGIHPSIGQVVVYEDGSDSFDVAMVDGLAAMASDDTAQTISISYGVDEAEQDAATMQAENAALIQLAAQGQSVFVSAGDGGAYGREGNGLNAPDPGSQPFVVSVGGTTAFSSNTQQLYGEEAWNDLGRGAGATGGGVSTVWPIPAYQVVNGVSVAVTNGGSATNRNVPDVAAVANPLTGVAVYSALSGGWLTVGGTSASAPIWASYYSILDAASRLLGYGQLGFANPSLYLYGSYGLFNDVLDGSNGNTNLFGVAGFNAGYGYDNTTGWGSMLGGFLEDELILAPATGAGPAPVIGMAAKAKATSVLLQWTAVPGVVGYLAQGATYNGNVPSGNEITTHTSVVFQGLSPNTAYTFMVYSISSTGYTIGTPLTFTTPAA